MNKIDESIACLTDLKVNGVTPSFNEALELGIRALEKQRELNEVKDYLYGYWDEDEDMDGNMKCEFWTEGTLSEFVVEDFLEEEEF